MYTPDFDEFCALSRQGNLIPVYREILADLETPVSAFLKIDDGGHAFLLECVEQEISDPLEADKELLQRYRAVPVKGIPPFSGGLVGYVGYDMVRFFERLPDRATDDLDLPDLYLMLVDTLLLFDNTA